jgi:hypothetical protein
MSIVFIVVSFFLGTVSVRTHTMELVAFANVESYFTLRFEGTELCSFLRFVEI